MKRVTFISMIFVTFFLFYTLNISIAQNTSYICEDEIVSIGCHSSEVLRKCGEPNSKEIIGYALTKSRRREFKIEEWIEGPIDGFYYILAFQANRLIRIKQEIE